MSISKKKQKKIEGQLQDNRIYGLLKQANKLSGEEDLDGANNIIRDIRNELDYRNNQDVKAILDSLKHPVFRNLLPHLKMSFENGKVYIEAIPDEDIRRKELEHRSQKRMKGLQTVIVCIIVLMAAAGCFLVYDSVIKDHSVESIGLQTENTDLCVATDYIVFADISPGNASDKTIVWGCDNPNVVLSPDGAKLVLSANPSVAIGDSFTVTATSDRYGVASSITFRVVESIGLQLSSEHDALTLGMTTVIATGIDPKFDAASVKWSSDRTGASITGDAFSATVTIDSTVVPGTTVRITAVVEGSSISQSISLPVSSEMILRQDAIGSSIEIGSLYDRVSIEGDGYTVASADIEIRSRGTPLTIVLDNASFSSASARPVISSTSDSVLTLEIRGNVVLKGHDSETGITGSDAIKAQNIRIILDGDLRLVGGMGAAGSSGSTGGSGYNGITASSVSVSGSGSITAIGGAGGRGGDGDDNRSVASDGSDASEGSYATSGANGGTGAAGGAGGRGGIGIEAKRLTVTGSPTISLVGGQGGNGGTGGAGGTGGNGGDGFNEMGSNRDAAAGGTGGTGGRGGSGGAGGQATTASASYSSLTKTIGAGGDGGQGGKGGQGGNGGDGGTNGWRFVGSVSTPDSASDGGRGGAGGDGGQGGLGGTGSISGNRGHGGNGGAGGQGGAGGVCEDHSPSSKKIVYGNDGAVGPKGKDMV